MGTFHHYEIDYSHSNRTVYVFADGVLVLSQSDIVIERIGRYVELGLNFYNMFRGSVSEFILKDGICTHTSDFTLPTEPYEVDEYTVSLLHFDK